MKRTLQQVSIETTLEAEEAVLELLARVLGVTGATYTNEETGKTVVSAYCARDNDWNAARQVALRAGMRAMRESGLDVGPGRLFVRRVMREDWAESWKRHFKPITIGGRLLIKPSWVKRRPRAGQAVVVLDPGLSFGTGNHPTTAFCLGELARCRRKGQSQSLWDLGTGSGILAIAGAKLGYRPVEAMDFDPEAVRVARENARKNRVSKQIRLRRGDITRMPLHSAKRHDIICANLISNLLIAERERIANRLAAGGTLVLAGILRKEFGQVRQAFERLGFELVNDRAEGEWQSGAFRRPASSRKRIGRGTE